MTGERDALVLVPIEVEPAFVLVEPEGVRRDAARPLREVSASHYIIGAEAGLTVNVTLVHVTRSVG